MDDRTTPVGDIVCTIFQEVTPTFDFARGARPKIMPGAIASMSVRWVECYAAMCKENLPGVVNPKIGIQYNCLILQQCLIGERPLGTSSSGLMPVTQVVSNRFEQRVT